MEKKHAIQTKLKLSRESIQLLDGGLQLVLGYSGQACSVSNCTSCRIPTCTTR